MALSGTLIANKDASPQGYQPLLLATFRFIDGSYLRLSTNPLNTAEGGYQYAGNDYLGRIANQDLQAVQSRSEQGIDRFPALTLHLNNADQYLWSNYEKAIGFKGATVMLSLVLFDINPSDGTFLFTSDSPVKYAGICNPGELEDGCATLVVSSINNHNLAKVFFPVLHVQQRCIQVFPRTAAERLAAGTDMGSWQFGCGYDPDQAGTDPEIGGDCRRGNYESGSTPFTDCNYTKFDCMARGMYTVDSSARQTGRFTAEQWAPHDRETQSKSYVEGKNVTVFSSRNDSIYNESYPVLYGSQWTKPLVVNVIGDGNSTRMEAVICVGDIGNAGVIQVVVNGVIVPRNEYADPLFRWNFVGDPALGTPLHTGNRNGVQTKDAGYNDSSGTPQGDPHGSLATIEIVVYRQLAESGSIPDVSVWANGPKVKAPNTNNPADQATWPYEFTHSPAYILMDVLLWANYRYNELDIATFRAAHTICTTSISYTDLHGATASHQRFVCEFFLRQRRAASELIPQILQSFNGQLVPNGDTGLLQLFIRQTLADQQPSAVAGSNYNTAVKSKQADGTVANGYVAYLFDEETILRNGVDGAPKVRCYSTTNSDTPNRISFPFQDSDNQYAQDSISVVDSDGVSRAGGYQGGQEVNENFQVIGISNFDQGTRISNCHLAERLRGNENGDTRGTRYFEIECTSRVAHLRVGHICLLRYQQLGLQPATQLQSPSGTGVTGILVRVLKIQPATNYETATITLQWHEDIWYTDAYGQNPAPFYSDPRKNRPNRLPYPWQPYGDQPIAGDSVFDATEWNFTIAQSYQIAADGTAIASLIVGGCPPVNTLSDSVQPPLMSAQGTTASTGGSLAGGRTILIGIAAQDSDGKWSALSKFCTVTIPTGTATNTATTPTIHWDAATSAYALFAGVDEQHLSFQAGGSGTPSTITLTALNVAAYGPPDILFDHLVIRVKRAIHSGVWGAAVTAVGTGTLQFAGAGFTTNQYAGYDVSLVSKGGTSLNNVPRANFRVISNDADTLTVTPDPSITGILAGYIFVMRFKPDTVTETTIGDSNFINSFYPSGMTVDAEIGNRLRIVSGTGRGQLRTIIDNDATRLKVDPPWDTTPDSSSKFVVEEAAWQDAPDIERLLSSELAPSPVPTVAKINIANYAGQSVLVQCVAADSDDNWALEPFCPIREVYLFGSPGEIAAGPASPDVFQPYAVSGLGL